MTQKILDQKEDRKRAKTHLNMKLSIRKFGKDAILKKKIGIIKNAIK